MGQLGNHLLRRARLAAQLAEHEVRNAGPLKERLLGLAPLETRTLVEEGGILSNLLIHGMFSGTFTASEGTMYAFRSMAHLRGMLSRLKIAWKSEVVVEFRYEKDEQRMAVKFAPMP